MVFLWADSLWASSLDSQKEPSLSFEAKGGRWHGPPTLIELSKLKLINSLKIDSTHNGATTPRLAGKGCPAGGTLEI
jgi:hypothetical protein